MNRFPASDENFAQMKGSKFIPHDGEGVVYIKLVALTPETMEHGNPAAAVDTAEGTILTGKLDDIQHQLNKWFDDLKKNYNPPKQEKY